MRKNSRKIKFFSNISLQSVKLLKPKKPLPKVSREKEKGRPWEQGC